MSISNSSKGTIPQKFNRILLVRSVWFKKAIKAIWILFLLFHYWASRLCVFGTLRYLRIIRRHAEFEAIENPEMTCLLTWFQPTAFLWEDI